MSIPSINLIDLSGEEEGGGKYAEQPKTERTTKTTSTMQQTTMQPYKSNPTEGYQEYSMLQIQNPNMPYMSTPGVEENNSFSLEIPVRKVREIKLSAPNKNPPVSLDLLLLQQQEEHFQQRAKNGLATIEESPENEVSYEEFLKKLELQKKNLASSSQGDQLGNGEVVDVQQSQDLQLPVSDGNDTVGDNTNDVSYEEFLKKLELQKKINDERDNDLYGEDEN